jgi:hypothetical protein
VHREGCHSDTGLTPPVPSRAACLLAHSKHWPDSWDRLPNLPTDTHTHTHGQVVKIKEIKHSERKLGFVFISQQAVCVHEGHMSALHSVTAPPHCSRVFLATFTDNFEKLVVAHLPKIFLACYGNRRCVTVLTWARQRTLPSSQLNPVNILTSYFLMLPSEARPCHYGLGHP